MGITEIMLALGIWLFGAQQTTPQDIGDWQDTIVAELLPDACGLYEDGSGSCAVTDCDTLHFPGFDNAYDGVPNPTVPWFEATCEAEPQKDRSHYGRPEWV